MIRQRLFVLALLAVLSSAVGCRSVVDGERGFPPFFGRRTEPETGATYTVFRPFFGYRVVPEKFPPRPNDDADSARSNPASDSEPTTQQTLTTQPVPATQLVGDAAKAADALHAKLVWEREWVGLWPIFRDRRRPDSRRSWLFPLYARNDKTHIDGTEDLDSFVFPFAFWGNDADEGGYLLVLPLGGITKGILGQRRMSWFLFPLFGRFMDPQRTVTHVLFPIFALYEGPQLYGGRVFPFFGRTRSYHEDGRLRSDRSFFLWPFWLSHDNLLDTSLPSYTRALLPFYAVTWNEFRTDRTYLWPIFRIVHDDETGERRFQLFPFLDVSRGGPQERTDVWPFFGVKESAGRYRQFLLYPLQQYRRVESGTSTQRNFWLLPIYWNHWREEDDEGVVDRYQHLYPLFSHRRAEDGTTELRILDLLPFRDNGWWERTYSRLWQIYRHVDHHDERGRGWEFLWGVLDGEERADLERFRILGGLFERGHENGDGYFRLLWFRFG